MNSTAHIDLDGAILLADMISSSVRGLVRQSTHNALDVSGMGASNNAHEVIATIVAATSQLSSLVRTPEEVLVDYATAYHVSAALRFVTEASVPEAITKLTRLRIRAAPHVCEIAGICGLDPEKLARILRLLATHGIFSEVTPNVFTHTRLSAALDSGVDPEGIVHRQFTDESNDSSRIRSFGYNDTQLSTYLKFDATGTYKTHEQRSRWRNKYCAPTSGAALSALVGILTDESMLHSTALTEALLYDQPARRNADSPHAAPFSYARRDAHDAKQDMFDWLGAQEPDRAHRLARFGEGMRGMSSLEPHSILNGFDWSSLPEGSSVVDVGGGNGSAIVELLRMYPDLHAIVQDRKDVLGRAPDFWRSTFPEALREGRVTFEPQDFFEPQPRTRNRPVGVFLLRMILHNWPDAEALKILRRLRASCSELSQKKTRLLIVDCVLMHACRDYDPDGEHGQGGLQMPQAPVPLIPNWGAANALAYKFDLLMLSNHNACERTYAQLSTLLAQAGWRISADQPVYAPKGSWLAAVVAEPGPLPADILPSPTRLTSIVSHAYKETGTRPSWSVEIEEVPVLLDPLQLDVEKGVGDDSGSLHLEKESDRSPTLVGSPMQRSSRWPWTLKTRNNRLIEAPSASDTMISVCQESTIGREKSKLSQNETLECSDGKGWCKEPLACSEVSRLDDDTQDQNKTDDVQNIGKAKEIGKRRSLWFTFKSGGRTPRSRRAELPKPEIDLAP